METRYALMKSHIIQVGAPILFHLIFLEHQVVLTTRGISKLKKHFPKFLPIKLEEGIKEIYQKRILENG